MTKKELINAIDAEVMVLYSELTTVKRAEIWARIKDLRKQLSDLNKTNGAADQ